MGVCLKIIRILWLIWILFLYWFALPAIYRPAGVFTNAIHENEYVVGGYYAEHHALPPELLLYAEAPEKAGVHPGKNELLHPAVIRCGERELVVAARVSLGLGNYAWIGKPAPLLLFPENVKEDNRIIMMFFDPLSASQRAVVKSGEIITTARNIPTEEVERFLRERGIVPDDIRIQRPRWFGMIFNVLVSMISACLFWPFGKIPPWRRGVRAVVICGAVIPLVLMLCCVDYPPWGMLLLGCAVFFCGLVEAFGSLPKKPDAKLP